MRTIPMNWSLIGLRSRRMRASAAAAGADAVARRAGSTTVSDVTKLLESSPPSIPMIFLSPEKPLKTTSRRAPLQTLTKACEQTGAGADVDGGDDAAAGNTDGTQQDRARPDQRRPRPSPCMELRTPLRSVGRRHKSLNKFLLQRLYLRMSSVLSRPTPKLMSTPSLMNRLPK
jgi:hypothetical protein